MRDELIAELLLELADWLETPWPPRDYQKKVKLIERARKMAKEFAGAAGTEEKA